MIWDRSDIRATVRQEAGPRKNIVAFDAQRGQLWVPLASGLAAFNLVPDWVGASNRINVRAAAR